MINRSTITALLCGLCWAAPASGQARSADSTLSIFFMDVGQGDATWIITGQGRRILVDAGRSRRVIEPHLWEGPDTLDLLVASHNHVDHIGGLPWVFDRFVVRRYVDNALPHQSDAYASVSVAVRREGGMQYLPAPDTTLDLGYLRLRILPPDRGDPDQNDNSVGVLIEFGQFRALISGDSPRALQDRWVKEGRIPRLHVLKAAHHGASDGWSADLARVARPGLVVISSGANNGYGHPNPRVVRTWEGLGARVLNTASHGTVFIRASLDGTYSVIDAKVLRAPLRAQSTVSYANDTAFFAAVVREAQRLAQPYALRVDPRPMPLFAADYHVPRAVKTAPVSFIADRIRVLQRLRVDTVDAQVVGLNAACPGIFRTFGAADEQARIDSLFMRCPHSRFQVAAVGIPRSGQQEVTADGIYDREVMDAQRGLYAVRILVTLMTTRGATLTAYDVVLRETGGRWTMLKSVPLYDAH